MIMPFPFTFIFNVPGLMNPFGGIGADSSAGAVSTPTTGHGHSVHSHGHAHAHQAATSVHRPNIPPIANPNGGPAPPYVPHHLGLQSLNQSQSQSQSQSQQSLAQAHLQHQLALHHPSNPSTSSSNLIIRPTRTRVSSRANLPKINRPPPEELERQQLLLHPQDPDVDSLRSLPTNRKRGWEPSFGSRAGDSSKSRAEAEAVVSSTTVSSKTASGYLGQLGRSGPGMGASWSMRGDRQEGEDEQEDEGVCGFFAFFEFYVFLSFFLSISFIHFHFHFVFLLIVRYRFCASSNHITHPSPSQITRFHTYTSRLPLPSSLYRYLPSSPIPSTNARCMRTPGVSSLT
ncbi:hypothetical protein CPB83DRAFT_289685 [Crepidotus variabilis]|uniref:Uncharacterized protein n=1 Tax=Crepidotus variabilis TaxID=179855 RepID=A0A9P6EHD0_9AGAR|nr:hypothetical protein CPB83DRAFT_289685 [Crepidotus variabilis]